MPIRPELRHFYRTPEWIEAREAVARRSEGRCEWCGVRDGAVGVRTPSGVFVEALQPCGVGQLVLTTWGTVVAFRIVLTTAHLDHNPEQLPQLDRLAHLCQRCHNKHDAPQRAANRRRRRRAAAVEAGQSCLFPE